MDLFEFYSNYINDLKDIILKNFPEVDRVKLFISKNVINENLEAIEKMKSGDHFYNYNIIGELLISYVPSFVLFQLANLFKQSITPYKNLEYKIMDMDVSEYCKNLSDLFFITSKELQRIVIEKFGTEGI